MDLGPLKNFADEGILVDRDDDFLKVVLGRQMFVYKKGCIEESKVVQMYDDLFAEFSWPPQAGKSNTPLMMFRRFVYYARACGQVASWQMYETICADLGVHPDQGLTAGDFRRMYCEFEGDIKEDCTLVKEAIAAIAQEKRKALENARIDSKVVVRDPGNTVVAGNPQKLLPTLLPGVRCASICKMCNNALADTILMPCMHGGLCGSCAKQIVAATRQGSMCCPHCQGKVQGARHVSRAWLQSEMEVTDVDITIDSDSDDDGDSIGPLMSAPPLGADNFSLSCSIAKFRRANSF